MAKQGKSSKFAKGRRNSKSNMSTKYADGVQSLVKFPTNDISWYNHNPELTKASANISWYPTMATPFYGSDGTADQIPNYGAGLPGIMIFPFHPSYGISTQGDSPLNFAATQLFTKDRAANSGRVNYEHTTFFMYTVAVDSLLMFWNHCQRAMQLINCYAVENRYLPKVLIEALGFDYEDLMDNQANFKLWMNTYAKQISTFILPKSCDLFVRHSWMCSNVYRDDNSVRAQLYCFRPESYYVFDQISDPGKTMLKNKKITSSNTTPGGAAKLTINDAKRIVTEMVNGLIRSADVNIIIGDIVKAWGNDVMHVSEYNDIQLTPVYNDEVLRQIHNADIRYFGWHDLDVTQDIDEHLDAYLITNPKAYTYGNDSHVWLDTTAEHTGPEDVMIMTRLKCQPIDIIKSDTPSPVKFECTFRMVGTELLESPQIIYSKVDEATKAVDILYWSFATQWVYPFQESAYEVTYNMEELRFRLYGFALYSSFNHAPIWPIYGTRFSGDVPTTLLEFVYGAYDTITTIDENVLYNIHQTALISLLGL